MTDTTAPPALPVGPPAGWTMDERAMAAQHRHHAVSLRALAKAAGQTPDEYLAGLSATNPEAAAQGAALLAYDDHLRAKDQAAQAARGEADAEGWQRRALVAEGELQKERERGEAMAQAMDRMFRAQHSQGGERGNRGGTGRPGA